MFSFSVNRERYCVVRCRYNSSTYIVCNAHYGAKQLLLIRYVQTHPWRDMLPEETQKQLHFSVLKTMKVQQVTKGESTQVAADLYTQNLKKLFAEVDRCP